MRETPAADGDSNYAGALHRNAQKYNKYMYTERNAGLAKKQLARGEQRKKKKCHVTRNWRWTTDQQYSPAEEFSCQSHRPAFLFTFFFYTTVYLHMRLLKKRDETALPEVERTHRPLRTRRRSRDCDCAAVYVRGAAFQFRNKTASVGISER